MHMQKKVYFNLNIGYKTLKWLVEDNELTNFLIKGTL